MGISKTLIKTSSLTQFFCIIEPPRIVPFSFGSAVVDSGDFAQLTCAVSRGDMPITITWSLKGQELNSGPSITTTMVGTRTSMLIISDVDYTHIGEYTCRATNPAGSVTHAAELNVNGTFIWSDGKTLEIVCIYALIKTFSFRTTQHCSFLLWQRCC